MAESSNTRTTVREALDHALANGYWYGELDRLSDERVAEDVLDYTHFFDDVEVEDLVPYIKEWRDEDQHK